MCVFKTYLCNYITAHHLQLKCIGGYFFPCYPYIESTTILSDTDSPTEPQWAASKRTWTTALTDKSTEHVIWIFYSKWLSQFKLLSLFYSPEHKNLLLYIQWFMIKSSYMDISWYLYSGLGIYKGELKTSYSFIEYHGSYDTWKNNNRKLKLICISLLELANCRWPLARCCPTIIIRIIYTIVNFEKTRGSLPTWLRQDGWKLVLSLCIVYRKATITHWWL